MARMSKWCLAVIAALLFTGNASAADQADSAPATVVESAADAADRMTVPVTINGQGPYHFIVDTGADRTVVSRELATRLALVPGEPATMHSMSGVGKVATVVVPLLTIAGRTVTGINAPALAAANLGADGLLGLDALQERRIIMDFKAQTLSIAPSNAKPSPAEPDTIVVTARSRYGQLMLVDADVDGVSITVIIDSGAQNTVGNAALRSLLARKNRRMVFSPTTLLDVTGGRLAADLASASALRIGGITLNAVPIAFADAHPFKRFHLLKRPAMLLGVDTLRVFERVTIDFAQRKVRFRLPLPT